MLVAKICKRALLVLAVVMLLASAVMAAPQRSALIPGNNKSLSDDDDSLERVLDDGITVVADVVSKADWVEVTDRDVIFSLNTGGLPSYLGVRFLVTTEEDTVIKVNGEVLYDAAGNEIKNLYGIWIGDQQVSERRIIAGIPTPIRLAYRIEYGGNTKITTVYPRVGVAINGELLVFRNVPGRP